MNDLIKKETEFLKTYAGRELRIMEICGSHTASITKSGLRAAVSEKIKLISGPGCPVCVTPSAYIDRLIKLGCEPGKKVAVFGDMLRVPGSEKSLSQAKGEGCNVVMCYSPLDVIDMAEEDPDTEYIFGAVGFETTVPAYALLMEEAIEKGLKNVRLLTSIKTMPNIVRHLTKNGNIDGFLAPGHVCAVTGSGYFKDIAEESGVFFGIGGFKDYELAAALCGIVKNVTAGNKGVVNYYPSAVAENGDEKLLALVKKYFKPCDAVVRGMGVVAGAGLCLRDEYAGFDAGSSDITEDKKYNKACRCGEVLTGSITPAECPLFGKICTPYEPQGACMVSPEGACNSYYVR